MTNKLTKAQDELLNKMQGMIDKARSVDTYDEYFIKYEASMYNPWWNTPEKYKANDIRMWNIHSRYWEEERESIVTVHVNSKTLHKLEEYGLIEIIYDSTNHRNGWDKAKVLNY